MHAPAPPHRDTSTTPHTFTGAPSSRADDATSTAGHHGRRPSSATVALAMSLHIDVDVGALFSADNTPFPTPVHSGSPPGASPNAGTASRHPGPHRDWTLGHGHGAFVVFGPPGRRRTSDGGEGATPTTPRTPRRRTQFLTSPVEDEESSPSDDTGSFADRGDIVSDRDVPASPTRSAAGSSEGELSDAEGGGAGILARR